MEQGVYISTTALGQIFHQHLDGVQRQGIGDGVVAGGINPLHRDAELAAQHNRVGGRGVAPGATILSYSPVRIGIEMHTALKHEHEDVAVSNNSWGWISLERPHSNLEAIEEGVLTGITDGFHGKGTLYVFPTTSTVNSNMSSAESFYAILPVCGVGEDGTAIGEGNNEGGYGDNLWVCAGGSQKNTPSPAPVD